jgi:hypothetical protein
MTAQQASHAKKVVDRFRELIGEESSRICGEGHWEELGLLIESAIDAAVFDAEERICEKIESFAQSIRANAEFFERK